MRKSFTLLELLVAVGIFSLMSVSASGLLVSIFNSWRTQRTDLDLVQNARWAVQFIANELRRAPVNQLLRVVVGAEATYALHAVSGSTHTWFWREGTTLYRGEGVTFTDARSNAQELANYLFYDSATPTNPKNDVFSVDSSLDSIYYIDLILNREGRSYTVRGQVRPLQSQ